MKKLSQAEQIRQRIAELPSTAEFTVAGLIALGFTRRSVEQTVGNLFKDGKITRLRKGMAGQKALYTNVASKLIEPSKPFQSIPLEKAGEAILAYTQLLKRQIYDQEERIAKLRFQVRSYQNDRRDFEKALKEQDEQIKTLGEKIREASGKTFPMNEVARVIRSGKLDTSQAEPALNSIKSLNDSIQLDEAEETREKEA